jgi:hypothetical protein
MKEFHCYLDTLAEVRISVPDDADNLSILMDWLALVQRSVTRHTLENIEARQRKEAASSGINPS